MDVVAVFGEHTSVHFIGIQEGVSLCSTILIMMLLIWTYFAFDDEQQKANKHVQVRIKSFCYISIISYLIMSAIMATLLNNFVVLSQTVCQTFYCIFFLSFNIGNISMYLMTSFHIQSIFPSSINGTVTLSPYLILFHRIFCIMIPSALWNLYLLLAFEHIAVTQISEYKYCWASSYHSDFLPQVCLSILVFCHAACVLFLLFSMVHSAKNYTSLISNNMNSKKRTFIKKLATFIRKASMLCILSILCMLIVLCLSAFVLQQIIFFLVIDGLVNVYFIICLLNIGNSFYSKTCGKVERLCKCTYCIFDCWLDKKGIFEKRQYYISPLIDDENRKIVPLNADPSKTKTRPMRPHQPSITPFSGIRSSKSKSSPFRHMNSFSTDPVLIPLADSQQSQKNVIKSGSLATSWKSVASEIEMETTFTDAKGQVRIE